MTNAEKFKEVANFIFINENNIKYFDEYPGHSYQGPALTTSDLNLEINYIEDAMPMKCVVYLQQYNGEYQYLIFPHCPSEEFNDKAKIFRS